MIVNQRLRNVWDRAAMKWTDLAPTQRRNLLIVAVALLATSVAILWVFMRPNYVTIMSGLDSKSLGEVQTELQTLKIPNTLNGSAVAVPASQADTARVQLAMAGLPKSGYIGYSSVSNSFGMTQDQFNVQVLDALQQSLNETIQSIDGVNSAQVHIVMPDQQLFVQQADSSAKASVFVEVAPGVQLSAAQVAGIQELVAHSVKGLTQDNVTVTDQNGVTLSSSHANAATSNVTGTSEIATRQQLEQNLQTQIKQGLDDIVGAGNAVVIVHANVTFDQTQTKGHYLQTAPGQTTGYPTSTETTRSSSTSPSGVGGASGVSGTNPNLPSYSGTAGGGNATSSSSDTKSTYDYSTVDKLTVGDPIQISGYSVGVFLNSNDKALTGAVVNQIKSWVANAVGQNGVGANNVTVSTVPFQASSTGNSFSKHTNLFTYGGIGAGVLLASAGALVLFRRRKARLTAAVDLPSIQVPASLETLPLTEDEMMKDQLVKLANQKPDEFTNLLRTWLAGDDAR